jgi:hypothetical protein
VGEILFWVHHGDAEVDLVIEGMDRGEVRIHTESTLSGDRECGKIGRFERNRLTVPPRSFGYALPVN